MTWVVYLDDDGFRCGAGRAAGFSCLWVRGSGVASAALSAVSSFRGYSERGLSRFFENCFVDSLMRSWYHALVAVCLPSLAPRVVLVRALDRGRKPLTRRGCRLDSLLPPLPMLVVFFRGCGAIVTLSFVPLPPIIPFGCTAMLGRYWE